MTPYGSSLTVRFCYGVLGSEQKQRRNTVSADNGYFIRIHPNGGFAAVMYFASQDDDDIEKLYSGPVDPSRKQFATLEEAIDEANGKNDDFGYGSEYGYSLGQDVLAYIREANEQPKVVKTTCPHCHKEVVVEVIVK